MDGAVGEVGFDFIAFVQFVDGADEFSVLGEEAVPALVEALGVACREALFEHFDTVSADEELSLGSAV